MCACSSKTTICYNLITLENLCHNDDMFHQNAIFIFHLLMCTLPRRQFREIVSKILQLSFFHWVQTVTGACAPNSYNLQLKFARGMKWYNCVSSESSNGIVSRECVASGECVPFLVCDPCFANMFCVRSFFFQIEVWKKTRTEIKTSLNCQMVFITYWWFRHVRSLARFLASVSYSAHITRCTYMVHFLLYDFFFQSQ